MILISDFKASAKELKSLRSVTIAAMLLALHTVLSVFVTIHVTESLRISVSFVATCVTAYFFGPVVGFLSGALGDIIQYLIKPAGGYFFGWTLNAALAGLVYGIGFYHRAPRSPKRKKASIPTGRTTALLPWFCSAGILISWFAAPFLTVMEKTAPENDAPAVLSGGTAFHTLAEFTGRMFSGDSSGSSAAVLAALILVVSILTGFLNLRKSKMLPMLLSTLTCFILLLSAYTDRKHITAGWGFPVMALLFLLTAGCHLVYMTREHDLDIRFLARTFLVMCVTGLLINAIFGTYWCTILYGNHFMFYFVPRFVKSLIQAPINTVLIYYLLRAVSQVPELRRQ